MFEHHQPAKPVCAVSQATHQRISHRLCPASVVQGGCVTSVSKLTEPMISSQPHSRNRTNSGCCGRTLGLNGFQIPFSTTPPYGKPWPTDTAWQLLLRKLMAQLVVCELFWWGAGERRDVSDAGLGLTNVNRVTRRVSGFIGRPDGCKRFHLPGVSPVCCIWCHDQS